MRFRLAIPPLAAGALTAVAVTVPSSAAPDSRSSQGACTPRSSIDAIIDDSGSMSGTDPTKLRVEGLKQLKSDPDNARKNLGGIEFGSDAQPLFNLLPIGANSTGMDNILDGRINADNGGTNYNAAFELAKTHGANANALIFLTDGGHNEGTYAENHKQNKPVYVIGLGVGTAGDADDQRLNRIATETGGFYKRVQTAPEMKTAMNEINAALNCRRAPVTFVDTFNRVGQTKAHGLSTGRGDGSVNLTANWASAADAVQLQSFTLVRRVTVPATTSQRRRRKTIRTRLKAIRRPGATFATYKVKLPRKRSRRRGRLRFRVKATRIANPALGLQVTTQASRSRRR